MPSFRGKVRPAAVLGRLALVSFVTLAQLRRDKSDDPTAQYQEIV
jgi:hypothetical protein